jgi:hypothetical protein
VTRAQALSAAAGIIGKSVSDLAGLIDLLQAAGQTRMATALRARWVIAPPSVGGRPRCDPKIWARRSVR